MAFTESFIRPGRCKTSLTAHHLLFVEDDEDLLEVFVRRFTRRGFLVSGAAHPHLALDLVQTQPIHVAVVDRNLPDMDGLVLTNRMKQLKPNLTIIMLSGDSRPEAQSEALESGVHTFLLKPCRLAELETVIQSALFG